MSMIRRPLLLVTIITAYTFIFLSIQRFYNLKSAADLSESRPGPAGSKSPVQEALTPSIADASPLLPYYQPNSLEAPFCRKRFSLEFYQTLLDNRFSYCKDGEGASQLYCFHVRTTKDGRLDTMCIGQGAYLDPDTKKMQLDCPLKGEADIEEGQPMIKQFREYWFETGPKPLFKNTIGTGPISDEARRTQLQSTTGTESSKRKNFTILVHREASAPNFWHSLMMILSYAQSMEILSLSVDPSTNAPFFSPEDVANTQIVIVDDHPDDPYFPLWQLFAAKPILRYEDLDPAALAEETIIVPLAGITNPLWQGDWKPFPCARSELLDGFAARVLDFFEVPDAATPEMVPGATRPITLTFIDRVGQRRLLEQEARLEALRMHFKAHKLDVRIKVVDWAAMELGEQVRVAHETDVMVGVHGAGLTHQMWMRPGSAVVELQPRGLRHKGFRNVAKMRGHHFFRAHTDKLYGGDWHDKDVAIGEERFVEIVDLAVRSVLHRGLLESDAV